MGRRNYVYPAQFEPDETGGFVVTFRDIAGAITQGDDLREALENAADALAEMVAAMVNAKEKIPAPSKMRRGEVEIPLDPIVAAKASLNEAMRTMKLNNVAFAKKLGVQEGEVRRLRDATHATRIGKIIDALRELNLAFSVSVEPAPTPKKVLKKVPKKAAKKEIKRRAPRRAVRSVAGENRRVA